MNDTKKFLKQVKIYDTQINNKLIDLQHLWDMATKVTTAINPNATSHGGNHDKLGDCVSKIADLEAEINQSVDAFVQKKRDVSRIVDRVTDADQLGVLHKRYFEYMTFEQIAYEMHMSYRNVCYTHEKALRAVKKIREELDNGGE